MCINLKNFSKLNFLTFLVLTTLKPKYYLNELSYRWVAYAAGFVPVLTLFMSVWTFGNRVYFSVDKLIDDVQIHHEGLSQTLNSFRQRYFQNVSFSFDSQTWSNLSEANSYLVDSETHPTYMQQLWLRTMSSVYYRTLFYVFIGYIWYQAFM